MNQAVATPALISPQRNGSVPGQPDRHRGPMPRDIGPLGQRARTGLSKHVLAQRLVPCDGKVTVLLPAVAAAA